MDPFEKNPELIAGLTEAARLTEVGAPAEALDVLLQLEPTYPEDSTLLCMIGAVADHLGAEGMAVDFFSRCLATEPTDVQVLITAGAGLAAAGDPGAEPALRLAALSAPDDPRARMHYGALLVRNGLLSDGLDELLAALSLDAGDPDIRCELGIAYLLRDDIERALGELEAASAAAPDDGETRLLWGLVLLQAGETSRAAEELHPLAEALAEDGTVQLLLALVFALEGWENEAWLALSRAETAEPLLDRAAIGEVEEALEGGDEAVSGRLMDELAPTLLRERLLIA